jgi:hypothetical protein
MSPEASKVLAMLGILDALALTAPPKRLPSLYTRPAPPTALAYI